MEDLNDHLISSTKEELQDLETQLLTLSKVTRIPLPNTESFLRKLRIVILKEIENNF